MNLRDTRRRRREHPDMEMTPLIDVVFLLLIFFLVTTTFSAASQGENAESNIDIQLPEASSGEASSPADRVIVIVREDGAADIQTEMTLEGESLGAKLKDLRARKPEMAIVLKGDEDASHGQMIDVLDRIREAGFRNVSLVARQRQAGSGD